MQCRPECIDGERNQLPMAVRDLRRGSKIAAASIGAAIARPAPESENEWTRIDPIRVLAFTLKVRCPHKRKRCQPAAFFDPPFGTWTEQWEMK